jgi:hypothetical protein
VSESPANAGLSTERVDATPCRAGARWQRVGSMTAAMAAADARHRADGALRDPSRTRCG